MIRRKRVGQLAYSAAKEQFVGAAIARRRGAIWTTLLGQAADEMWCSRHARFEGKISQKKRGASTG